MPTMARPRPGHAVADAASSMLEPINTDGEGVIMHQLAKGSIDSSNSTGAYENYGGLPVDASGSSQCPDAASLPVHLRPLQSIGIIELLEHDDMPTFIVDLVNPNFGSGKLRCLFSNAAMRASEFIVNPISLGASLDPSASAEFDEFKAWVVSHVADGRPISVRIPSFSYGGVTWTCSTLRKRYRVVRANGVPANITPISSPSYSQEPGADLGESALPPERESSPAIRQQDPSSDSDYFGTLDATPHQAEASLSLSPDKTAGAEGAQAGLHMAEASGELARPSFDWTRIAIHPGLPQHILFARSINWAATPLGPIEHWPADLRIMSNLIMGSPNPSAMYWGREYTAIYNEAYTKLAAKKHPMMMGTSYKVVFQEIWNDLELVFDNAWNRGQATMKNDDRLFLIRNGFLEETYFNWAIIPLVGGSGNVVALYNPAFESTSRKLNERRMLTLREVGAQTSQATDVKSFWRFVLKAFEYNEFDMPFVMIYSTAPDGSENEASSVHSGSLANSPLVVLEGALGVPTDHPTAVRKLDLRTSEEGFAPYMRESMSNGGDPIVLKTNDLPRHLVDGLQWRGFEDPSTIIVVFPVHPTSSGDACAGFIVMGTNPRRPYDRDYDVFIQVISRQLATSMAAVALLEEEIRRGERAVRMAALDRQELSLQLRLRTQEAVESEYKFTRMAEFAPVGIFITDDLGKINYCNDFWWQISRHPRSHDAIGTWMRSVRDEDRPALEAAWDRLVGEKVAITHEFRFKTPSLIDGHPTDTWVLMNAYPEKDGAGDLKCIFGCVTEITTQKHAEKIQRQRREEAVELKRQQENFIDMTSHEMRNPLSAILQCADEIKNGLVRIRKAGVSTRSEADMHLLLDGFIEAADTISLCANHQRRIVDDTLTFSKIDSQLIVVRPVDAQPVSTVRKALKMFESEVRSNDISVEFLIEESFEELGVDWVRMDPSRLQQVLINLLTNAIKFTSNSGEKPLITVSLGASVDDGSGVPPSDLDYFPCRSTDVSSLTDGPEWGTGDKIFLHFAIKYTGPGMDVDEVKLLFQRFSQASPRTHVHYGGYGLGLYICRILSELQGGQISVASKKGVGSSFSFYIKARKLGRGMVPAPRLSTDPDGPVGAETGDSSRPLGHLPVTAPAPPRETPTDRPVTVTETSSTRLPVATIGLPRRDPFATGVRPSPSLVLAEAEDEHTMRPLDVLIVEDNLVNQRVLQRQLSRRGNNTVVANHGEEALAVLRRSRFWKSPPSTPGEMGREQPRFADAANATSDDYVVRAASLAESSRMGSIGSGADPGEQINISVILMDLEMPVMDGMTCVRRIRELERRGKITCHIPVIAVTAYARAEQIAEARDAGIDDVVSKPFRMPELFRKIKELVSMYNTQESSVECPEQPPAIAPTTTTAV